MRLKRTLSSVLTIACLAWSEQGSLPPDTARSLAEEVYIYGYPLVLMHVTAESALETRPVGRNKLWHLRGFPTANFRTVVRPNVDTLYSSAWLDLSDEPLVLHTPDTKDRYYVIQLLDGWTETFASLGSRTTGTKAAEFVIVGPAWTGRLPRSARRVDAPTNFAWLLLRVQTNTARDYAAVHAVQDGFSLRPLSDVNEPYKPPEVQSSRIPSTAVPPVLVDKMDALTFFRTLAEAMKKSRPHAADQAMIHKLSQLGIKPGNSLDDGRLQPELRSALESGVNDARAKIATRIAKPAVQALEPLGGNWVTSRVGTYGTDYLKRAVVARIGLGALPPEDATYARTSVDSERRALSGAHRYEIHLGKDELPPVNAFWSITLYSPEGYLVENAVNRHAIGDRDSLERHADGSLRIYIQHQAPPGNESNWLPAPSGPFDLGLRLYWPREEILNRKWKAPPVRRIDD